MVADGREVEGWGWEGGGGMYLRQPFPPLINSFYQFSPTYQCNTQQVVVKSVISTGEFHVSGIKLHLTKTEMGFEEPGIF